MRKIVTSVLAAATLATTLGLATAAHAQEWGPPPPPPGSFGPGPGGWAPPPPPPPAWGQSDGEWGRPYHADYWRERHYWQWRHYREMRHREYCRWHGGCW